MTERGRKKRKLRVRTGRLLYTDAFRDLRMLIHFCCFESRALQYYFYRIQHPSLFPFMYIEKALQQGKILMVPFQNQRITHGFTSHQCKIYKQSPFLLGHTQKSTSTEHHPTSEEMQLYFGKGQCFSRAELIIVNHRSE